MNIQTCTESEEKALVRMFLQQSFDPLAHPLIALVDELLTKVAVNLLSCDLFTRRQSDVVEVGHLKWGNGGGVHAEIFFYCGLTFYFFGKCSCADGLYWMLHVCTCEVSWLNMMELRSPQL